MGYVSFREGRCGCKIMRTQQVYDQAERVKVYIAPNCRAPNVLVQSLLPETMCVWCFLFGD